ncbi:sulfite exporter TauE/SafE family protein [candidate division KSB1 bacterium]|nr:sulfite exporter TauE/SafE family protein [candidate division KSB1 bacterium]
MTLEYWFMFPISILIATIAMASGVEGATFFTPLFILALGLSPEIAIGTGLITEVFGFASGLYAYARKRLIDYKLGVDLLTATIPMALLGTWVAGYVPSEFLKVILGGGLLAIAISFLRAPDHDGVEGLDDAIQKEYEGEKAETCLVTREGEEIRYSVCNRNEGRFFSGLGGLFIGMISTGQGELNGYFLLQRCRVPSRVAVASSVFVVAITALVASTGHFIKFVQTGGETLSIVLSLVVFTVPGVLIGGQLGSLVSSRISQHLLERGLAILFILVAALTLGEVIL